MKTQNVKVTKTVTVANQKRLPKKAEKTVASADVKKVGQKVKTEKKVVKPVKEVAKVTKQAKETKAPAKVIKQTRAPKKVIAKEFKDMDKKELRAALKETKVALRELNRKQLKIEKEIAKR